MEKKPQRPDPDCPDCHGTGTMLVRVTFLDRVDEMPVECPRCAPQEPREEEAAGITPPDEH